MRQLLCLLTDTQEECYYHSCLWILESLCILYRSLLYEYAYWMLFPMCSFAWISEKRMISWKPASRIYKLRTRVATCARAEYSRARSGWTGVTKIELPFAIFCVRPWKVEATTTMTTKHARKSPKYSCNHMHGNKADASRFSAELGHVVTYV